MIAAERVLRGSQQRTCRLGIFMKEQRPDIWTRVNNEVRAGRLWRAKEILQGSICREYDLRIFERYGQILLLMRDNLEAGKYLFLSGSRKPEYEPARLDCSPRDLRGTIRHLCISLSREQPD
jgi:hypothetical protein